MLRQQIFEVKVGSNSSQPFLKMRQECPACGSRRFREIYRLAYDSPCLRNYLANFYGPQGKVELGYLAGASYVLCECHGCLTIFQQQVPGDTLMERLYEHWIDPEIARKARRALSHQYYTRLSSDMAQILSLYANPPGELRFLDFGMGWGAWAQMAKAYGVDSYGTELSKEQTDHGRHNGIKMIEWYNIPGQDFDFINTEQVFEHLVSPLETLKQLKNGLKQGGILKISVPFAFPIAWRIKWMRWDAPVRSRYSVNPVAPLEHINYFRRSSILTMGRSLGMRKVTIPLARQYLRSLVVDGELKTTLLNIARPVYRNTCGNFVLLQKCD